MNSEIPEPGNAGPVMSPPIIAPPQINRWRSSGGQDHASSQTTGRSAVSAGFVVLSAILLLFIMAVVGVTGYFRLSSPTAALRTSVMSAVPGTWEKTIALRIGWFTTALIRTGSRFIEMPPEPRAALDALHGAEVGIYKLEQAPARSDFGNLFVAADRAMKRRGWDRVVGVAQDQQFVAVYFPQGKVSLRGVKCCVVVFQGRDLVVASASGNLEPLLKIAEAHMDMGELRRCLPKGI